MPPDFLTNLLPVFVVALTGGFGAGIGFFTAAWITRSARKTG
ncbi:hypothetical protein [Pararhodobacter zhoushanensis]|nr:hypothetical protein [Pararhodobacter zhoushanensis]